MAVITWDFIFFFFLFFFVIQARFTARPIRQKVDHTPRICVLNVVACHCPFAVCIAQHCIYLSTRVAKSSCDKFRGRIYLLPGRFIATYKKQISDFYGIAGARWQSARARLSAAARAGTANKHARGWI